MLILAGVSLNAIVGDNGIITMAQKAKAESEKAGIIDQIEEKLLGYNISLITDDSKTSAKTAMNKLLSEEIIDSIMTSDGTFSTDTANLAAVPLTAEDGSWNGEFEYVVEKKGYVFNVYQDRDGTYTVGESDIVSGEAATGGNVTGGKTLVTSDTFTANDEEGTSDNDKGKYTIVGDASVIFADKLEGAYSIYVKSGVNATVSIFDDMTLSNTGLQRSAIDIEPGGTLNLWIADGATVTVDSGFAQEGEQATGFNAKGGAGGYAGIHVPKFTNKTYKIVSGRDSSGNILYDENIIGEAVLNVSGEGTLITYGGDASESNGSIGTGDSNTGGGRRWPVLELESVAMEEKVEMQTIQLLDGRMGLGMQMAVMVQQVKIVEV